MNKETFDKIQATLEGHIAACKFYLGSIETTDDLKKLTISEAQLLQRFCRQEEALQTKIMQCDLYHIIGMGDLTPPQMMKFTYLIRDYGKYRSTIKALAMNFDKISSLPGLPVSAVYKTHGFEGITLYTGPEPQVDSTIPVPYSIAGNLIKVQKDDLNKFVTFWTNKSKTPLSENNLLQKAKAGTEYGGVRWTVDSEGDFVGIIQANNTRMLFEGCYKNA